MKIRKAGRDDLKDILEIYAYARAYMKEHGNPRQWGDKWPPEELVIEDIETGRCHVCINSRNKVVGVFCLLYGEDIEPTYRIIYDGSWKDDSPYGVIHRIAADGSEKGIGSYCIRWACEKCSHMRIDTHGDNITMQRLLERIGFERRGTIYVTEDNDPRIAYEISEVRK